MTRAILFAALLLSFDVAGQPPQKADTLNRTDPDGFKQGWWIEELTQRVPDTDTIETTISQGGYNNNIKVGDWTTIYKGNGQVAEAAFYQDSVRLRCSAYDAHGRLTWRDSLDPVSGTTIYNTYYAKEQLSGVLFQSPTGHHGTTYWENGNMRSHWETPAARSSDEEWVFTEYWEDGTARQVQGFIGERVEHGITRRFYRNGQLEYECHYVLGELNGLYKKYDEEGNLVEVNMWVNGDRQ